MSKERIRKLAARYDRTIDEVVTMLGQLGESRYQRPDDQVPEAVVQRLDRAIKALPRKPKVQVTVSSSRFSFSDDPREAQKELPRVPEAIPEDPSLNAALQDYLSARPLEDLRNKLKTKGATPSPTSARPGMTGPTGAVAATQPPPASQTEAMLRDSLGAEIHKRRLLNEALDTARAELSTLKSSIESREQALVLRLEESLAARASSEHSLRSHLRQLEAERDSLKQALDSEIRAHREDKAQHEAQLVEARREIDALKVRLSELTIQKQVAESRAQALERRMQAEEEAAEPEPPRSRGVFASPPPSGPPAPLFPSGAAPVAQAPGTESGREEVVRQFIEMCSTYEIERINVVGGSPRYLQELKALLEPGIEVRGVDGTAAVDSRRARQHVDGADLTLVWAGSILLHRVANRYTDLKDSRVVLVSHRGLVGMLRQAMEAVPRVFQIPTEE